MVDTFVVAGRVVRATRCEFFFARVSCQRDWQASRTFLIHGRFDLPVSYYIFRFSGRGITYIHRFSLLNTSVYNYCSGC
jgi:hypothetical protein